MSRASVGWVIPISQVLVYCGNLGKQDPNIPNHAQGHMKSNPKTSAPHLTSNEVLLLCQSHLRVQLYLSYGYLSIREISGNWVRIPQIMSTDTQNVVESFQHHISHWMSSYSSAKAIWGLSYTCFRVFGVLGQFGETGPQCPNFSKIVKFYYLD